MKNKIKILLLLCSSLGIFSCLGPEVSLKPKTAAQVSPSPYKKILVEAFVPHPDFKLMVENIFRYYLQNAGVTSTDATEIFDPAKMNDESYTQERIHHYGIDAILQIEYQHSAERTLYKEIPKGSWAQAWASQDEDRSFTLKLIDVKTKQVVWSSDAEVSSIAMLNDSETDILNDFSKALAQKTVKELLKSGLIQATGKMFE